MATLFNIHTVEDLIIKEQKLEMAFHFFDVLIARTQFHTLVLSKIKQEAKLKKMDLKPFYADQADLYNSACFEGEFYSPICSPPRSPQMALADHAHQASSEQSLSTPHSPVRELEVVQPWPSYSTADLSALEYKNMEQVQVKLDQFKAKIDEEEARATQKVLEKIDGIDNTLTKSLNSLKKEMGKCIKDVHASMKQLVKEVVEDFADNRLGALVKEIAKGKIGVFANEQQTGYLKQFIPNLITPLHCQI